MQPTNALKIVVRNITQDNIRMIAFAMIAISVDKIYSQKTHFEENINKEYFIQF